MKIAVNTSTIQPVPLLDKVALVGDSGFDGIELWVNEIYDFIGNGGEISELEHVLNDNGLTIPCMVGMRGWGDVTQSEFELQLDEARRRFELCARLGSPWLVVTPPPDICDLGRLADRYRRLVECGREAGSLPIFEFIGFYKSVPNLGVAHEIITAAELSDAALLVDVFHCWNSGSGVESLVPIACDQIGHVHLNDATLELAVGLQRDPDRVMPGQGQIDIRSWLEALAHKGYTEWVSLELFNTDRWSEDPQHTLSEGYARLRDLTNQLPGVSS